MKKKNTDHDHDKYSTTPVFNNLTARVFTARLAKANVLTSTEYGNILKSLNQ